MMNAGAPSRLRLSPLPAAYCPLSAMNDPQIRVPRPWTTKFRDAFRGVWVAARGSTSYAVHLIAAAVVIAAAAWLQVERLEWCLLAGCMAAVLAAEAFNAPWNPWPRPSAARSTLTSATPWTSAAAPSSSPRWPRRPSAR